MLSKRARVSAPPHNWRPWPTNTYLLAAFSILCAAICTVIEFILIDCSIDGCRIFGVPSTVRVSRTANFVYNVLPTILSVCFNLLWAVVQHDIVRLEPYIQMSAPGGATAENSILLDYSYMFPLRIPFFALKRSHYVCFLSTCVLILANLLITPFTSGMFDDATIVKNMTSLGARGVIGAEPGDPKLSPRFAYMAYNYDWANGSLPAFTTAEYSLLPVKPGPILMGDNETWSAETILYEAELVCEPGTVTPMVHPILGRVGLNITTTLNSQIAYYQWDKAVIGSYDISVQYPHYNVNKTWEFSFYVTPWTSKMLRVYEMPNTYMFIWASQSAPRPVWLTTPIEPGLPLNITVVFCTASYHFQPVIATFAMPFGSVTSVRRTGDRALFKNGAGFIDIFNGSSLGLSNFPTSRAGYPAGLGSRPARLPNVDSQLRRRFGIRSSGLGAPPLSSHPPSNSSVFMESVYALPAFSLHSQTPETLWDLLDPHILAKTYRRELKLLFALAVAMELVSSGPTEPVTVNRVVYSRGFTVNCLWARISQGGLATVAIMTILIAMLDRRRRCMLDGEPNTLAAALQLLAISPVMRAGLENAEFHTEKALYTKLVDDKKRYQLVLDKHRHGPRIDVIFEGKICSEDTGLTPPDSENLGASTKSDLWVMKTSFGVKLLAFFGLLAVLFLVIVVYTHVNKGFSILGGTNSFGYKALYSYIPFVVGMTVEPILASVGSCYCMLQPYEALANHRSIKSLTTDYDTSPPHFQLLRSLRSGNITLAALAISILLANFLAIALGTVFSLTSVGFSVELNMETPSTPKLTGAFTDPAQSIFYALAANLSDGNDAPTWTTPEFFVVPFPFPGEDYNDVTGSTFGIGIDIRCSILPGDGFTRLCYRNDRVETCASVDDSWEIIGYDTGDTCLENMVFFGDNSRSFRIGEQKIVRSSLCPDTFFAGWVEEAGDPNHPLITQPYTAEPQAIILKCTTTETIQRITASVNRAGQVLSTDILRPLSAHEVRDFYSGGKSPGILTRSFLDGMVNAEGGALYKHDSLEWLSYLLVVLKPSIMLEINEKLRIPDTTMVVAGFEDLYRRLFAINLRLYKESTIAPGQLRPTSGKAVVLKDMVHASGAMVAAALTIIFYTIMVLAVLFWWKRPKIRYHVPTTLAGMYTLLYASHPRVQTTGTSPEERAKGLNGEYMFGEFVGENNRPHFGVHREGGRTVGS